MTAVGCRPEQREGPGFDCHSERSEESGFALFKIQIRFFVLKTRTQNDNTRFFGLKTRTQNETRPGTFESGQNDKRIEAFPLNFMPGYR